MRFASRVFRFAGIYGLVCLPPQYFLEKRIGTDTPPPITHPEFFYGFLGVAIAWQVAFVMIGRDPLRYRPLMLPAIVEKASFALAAIALFAAGRTTVPVLVFGCLDGLLGTLFAIAWRRTRPQMGE